MNWTTQWLRVRVWRSRKLAIAILSLLCLAVCSECVAAAGPSVPVFDRCDVVVVDGSLAGCVAAWELAQRGKDVVLASPDSSVPREIAVCLRSWAMPDDLENLPLPFRRVLISVSTGKTERGEHLFNVAGVCEAVEDLLIEAGVRFYYGATACGVLRTGETLGGVVFAGKFGLGAIEAGAVIDCTPRAVVARMAGADVIERVSEGSPTSIALCLLCEGAPPGGDVPVEVDGASGGGRIIMHGSFAEFKLRAAVDYDDPLYLSRLVVESRRALAEVVSSGNTRHRVRPLRFSRTPDALFVQPAVRIRSAGHRRGAWDAAETDEARAALCRPRSVENLWVCSAAVDVENRDAESLNDPWRAVAIGRVLAAAGPGLVGEDSRASLDASSVAVVSFGLYGRASRGSEVLAVGDVPPLRGPGTSVRLAGGNLPILAECDVLVVGGGTSGVPAALTAARKGMRVIVIEKHSDLGGTHTIGGVSEYWYGRDTAFRKVLDDRYAALVERGLPKAMAMTEVLRRQGITVLPKCLAAGTLVDGRTVRGVAVVTGKGLAGIRASVTIDATGDGDIAAWSGAGYEYGSGRDAMTLWCSFGEFKATGTTVSRQYDSVVDLRDPLDATRAIITGRRRVGVFGTGAFPQHYLTVRESRRIHGRSIATYGGILAGQTFEDLALVCRSNFDIKGVSSSDLARCGYVSFNFTENFTGAIAFGALLPRERENLLVIGKAYSVTHDALSLARMQRDLMSMGGAAGLAAALAVKRQTVVAEIDLPALQAQLVAQGILSQEELETWAGSRRALTKAQVEMMVARLAEGELDLPGKVRLLTQAERARAALRPALAAAETLRAKVEIARALCYLEDTTGVPILLKAIEQQTAKGLPPGKHMRHRYPDHGWAPEPVYLIYAIGLTRDRRLVPVLRRVAEKIVIGPTELDANFEYVLAICQAAERSGAKAMVPVLEALATRPGLRGLIQRYDSDPRRSVSVDQERRAYLELCVARALARCGSTHGYRTLIEYVADIRGFLVRSAHDELVALAGEDLGYGRKAWQEWLEVNSSSLVSKPYRKRLD